MYTRYNLEVVAHGGVSNYDYFGVAAPAIGIERCLAKVERVSISIRIVIKETDTSCLVLSRSMPSKPEHTSQRNVSASSLVWIRRFEVAPLSTCRKERMQNTTDDSHTMPLRDITIRFHVSACDRVGK
jgi:hypothetical protein